MYRIQIRQLAKNWPWYYRIVSPNGRILLTSETYANKPNATRAVSAFVENVYVLGGDAFTVEGNGE